MVNIVSIWAKNITAFLYWANIVPIYDKTGYQDRIWTLSSDIASILCQHFEPIDLKIKYWTNIVTISDANIFKINIGLILYQYELKISLLSDIEPKLSQYLQLRQNFDLVIWYCTNSVPTSRTDRSKKIFNRCCNSICCQHL